MRLKYHGGYSKHHYSEWHNFYSAGRAGLEKRLDRYCEKIQHTKSWLQNFINVNLVETSYFGVRSRTMNLKQFYELQLMRISSILGFMRGVWSSGVYSILMGKYVTKYDRKIRNIVFEEPSKMQFWASKLQDLPEQQELLRYSSILAETIKKSKLKKLLILPPCPCPRTPGPAANLDVSSHSMEIMFNIFYEELITRSLDSYVGLIMQAQRPLFNLDLVVDRQTLKFKENEERVVSQLLAVLDRLFGF